MRVIDEYRVEDDQGHAFILQKIGEGISYLDFGNTHLPHDFCGYRVKYSDRVAEQTDDEHFTIKDSGTVVHLIH